MLHFPNRLRAWRLARDLSQQELAKRAGLPRPNLVDLETGRRDCTLNTLARLAQALELSPGRLLDEFPMTPPRLNRHQVDTIAKNLADTNPSLTPALEEIHQQVLPIVYPLLRCCHLVTNQTEPQFERGLRYNRKNAEIKVGKDNLERIIKRLNKILASRL